MQYYNEVKMHDLRLEIEKEVLNWPNVTTEKMFGCPSYKNKDKLFAFLVTDGVVLTNVSEQDKVKVSQEFKVTPFQAGKRTMSRWSQISVGKITDLERILPLIKKSCDESA
jgi:hypothetical protein